MKRPFDFLFGGNSSQEKREKAFLKGKQTRDQERRATEIGGKLLQELIQSCDGRICYPIAVLSTKELIKAADNFSNCIHIGGYGNKYWRGTYEGRSICVKGFGWIGGDQQMAIDQAINEIVTVTQINHKNVPKLLGYCFEREAPMLVYDFIPNKSLSDFFENESTMPPLPWDDRLRIVTEIAYAATYLHTGASRPFVHRDLHCSNIMLDECYSPKLCDFSLTMTIPLDETHVTVSKVQSTYGITAPEYIASGCVTEKCDVYCFGVVMLELLSGKKVGKLIKMAHSSYSLGEFFTRKLVKERRLDLIMDPSLTVDVRMTEQVKAYIQLALNCIAREIEQRPSMKEVVLELQKIARYSL